MKDKDIDQLKDLVAVLLRAQLPTQAKIRECVERASQAVPQLEEEDKEEVIRWFEKTHGVTMSDGIILKQADFKPWLEKAREGWDDAYYWDRYYKLLAQKHLSVRVLATLDRVTDRILGLLENPQKEGRWDRRGMVMGHVQSGKTANYAGLICKAADAGYKVIIIIAGLHNSLRNQTQRRIDEGFIGFNSTGPERGATPVHNLCGVGHISSERRPGAFTSSQRDFYKGQADSVGIPLKNLVEPAVFVIKKNPSTLRNLVEWLRAHNVQLGTSVIAEPMLLIDDEADNASINISYQQDEISRINGQIRGLLQLFARSCYVGYTATPFANIFIDPDSEDEMLGDDLFPRDFIINLDPPDNYVGPNKVFGDDSAEIVCPVDDHAELLPLKHKKDHAVPALPATLEQAVRVFIVARAIRIIRARNPTDQQVGKHNSMLVNVSRFINVQKQVRDRIHEFVLRIRGSVRVNGARLPAEALEDPEINALFQAFEEHYSASCSESWAEIQQVLRQSVSALKVIEVNSKSPETLDYTQYEDTGLNVIAVGGLSLSRGLTLEGLVVSYFLRNSMMYDTLLQMGRWFGYRDGYEDLCRVWMLEEAQGWYTHITTSIEELQMDLVEMQQRGATPQEFGLQVRSHPTTLNVTARNKMGSGRSLRRRIGLGNSLIETAILRGDSESLEINRRAAISLADNLRQIGFPPEAAEKYRGQGGRLVRNAPVRVVDDFLMAFRNHDGWMVTESEPVRNYIAERKDDELAEWDIFFPGVSMKQSGALVDDSLGFELICQRRKLNRQDNGATLFANKHRVSSRGIEKTGLTDEEIRDAERKADEEDALRKGDGQTESAQTHKNYPDKIYRRVRTKPLLAVHLLAVGKEGEDLSDTKPVVAWSISFPPTRKEEETVEYIVNTRRYQEQYGEDLGDGDDEADED